MKCLHSRYKRQDHSREWDSVGRTGTRGHQDRGKLGRSMTLGAWRLQLPFQAAGQKDWKGQMEEHSVGNDHGGRLGEEADWIEVTYLIDRRGCIGVDVTSSTALPWKGSTTVLGA